MVTVTTAHTAPVNPPDATSIIGLEQLWKALKLKARDPKLFLPSVESCEVLSESENGLVRKVTFKQGLGLPSNVETEDIVFRAPYIAEFTMRSGTVIQNIISHGPSSSPSDLLLTFTFNFQRPDLAEGSKEAEELTSKAKDIGSGAVSHTIKAARELIAKGEV